MGGVGKGGLPDTETKTSKIVRPRPSFLEVVETETAFVRILHPSMIPKGVVDQKGYENPGFGCCPV